MVSLPAWPFRLPWPFISHLVLWYYPTTNDPCHDTRIPGLVISPCRITITLLVHYAYPCWLHGRIRSGLVLVLVLVLLLSFLLSSCLRLSLCFVFMLLSHGVQARRYHSGTHSASYCTIRLFTCCTLAFCLSRYHHTLGHRLLWSTDQPRSLDLLYCSSITAAIGRIETRAHGAAAFELSSSLHCVVSSFVSSCIRLVLYALLSAGPNCSTWVTMFVDGSIDHPLMIVLLQ